MNASKYRIQGRKPLMSRPSDYTPQLAESICNLLSDGMSLRAVCRLDDMPDRETVRRWVKLDSSFAANISRAREEGQDASIDEARDIAMQATPENWQVAQLQIRTIQWEASKRNARLFGDKVQHEVTGGATLTLQMPESVAKRLAERMGAAKVIEGQVGDLESC